MGWAAKASWFEVTTNKCEFNGKGCTKYPEGGVCADYLDDECERFCKKTFNIYKDPVTDDGTKVSLKGLQKVYRNEQREIVVKSECTPEEEQTGLLHVIYNNGNFHNQTTLSEIRNRLSK